MQLDSLYGCSSPPSRDQAINQRLGRVFPLQLYVRSHAACHQHERQGPCPAWPSDGLHQIMHDRTQVASYFCQKDTTTSCIVRWHSHPHAWTQQRHRLRKLMRCSVRLLSHTQAYRSLHSPFFLFFNHATLEGSMDPVHCLWTNWNSMRPHLRLG